MPVDVIVPPLGTTVDVLTLIEWYKQEGDAVLKDEPLFAVETDKATLDVEAPASGRLQRVTAFAGDSVTALTRIAVISADGELISDVKSVQPAAQSPIGPSRRVETAAPAAAATRVTAPQHRIFISPRAKSLAKVRQLNWRILHGTGPEGAIVERDVQSVLNVPQSPVTMMVEANATELVALHEKLTGLGVTAVYDDLLLLILARALREVPEMRCSLGGGADPEPSGAHIGLTIPVGDEFQIVIVRDVDKKGLRELAAETLLLREAAQAGRISAQQRKGAVVCLTNLGAYGIDAFSPVILLPDCPVLGVGRIKAPFLPSDPRYMLWITLTFDPRKISAGTSARFMHSVISTIENPMLALV